jgi:hypothetical protein
VNEASEVNQINWKSQKESTELLMRTTPDVGSPHQYPWFMNLDFREVGVLASSLADEQREGVICLGSGSRGQSLLPSCLLII